MLFTTRGTLQKKKKKGSILSGRGNANESLIFKELIQLNSNKKSD